MKSGPVPGEDARIVVAGKDSDTVPVGTLSGIRRASGLEHLRVSEYVVIFEQADDGGWGAYLPDLPGVVALGERATTWLPEFSKRSTRTPRRCGLWAKSSRL